LCSRISYIMVFFKYCREILGKMEDVGEPIARPFPFMKKEFRN
jgi:hypothetical protein